MSLTIETPIHFKRANAGKKTVAVEPAPDRHLRHPTRFHGFPA